MKSLPSNKKLMSKYCLNEKELLQIMNLCITKFLSEEELQEFIYELYMKKENKLNRKYLNH